MAAGFYAEQQPHPYQQRLFQSAERPKKRPITVKKSNRKEQSEEKGENEKEEKNQEKKQLKRLPPKPRAGISPEFH